MLNWFSVWKRLPDREVRTLTVSVIKINRHCVEFSTSLFTLSLEQWTGWVRTEYWCVLFFCLCPMCWFIIICFSLLSVWAVWHVYRDTTKLARRVTYLTYFREVTACQIGRETFLWLIISVGFPSPPKPYPSQFTLHLSHRLTMFAQLLNASLNKL